MSVRTSSSKCSPPTRSRIVVFGWAPEATIERIRADLAAERSTETFARRKVADAKRRETKQVEYVEDFNRAILAYLNFHPAHAALASQLARAVSDHATPVGSGTVARTKRIPIERRAQAAVIAWMRHQTTGYDSMSIARVKGKRREVRRMLAQRSKELLAQYRRGGAAAEDCPLQQVIRLIASADRQDEGSTVEESRPAAAVDAAPRGRRRRPVVSE